MLIRKKPLLALGLTLGLGALILSLSMSPKPVPGPSLDKPTSVPGSVRSSQAPHNEVKRTLSEFDREVEKALSRMRGEGVTVTANSNGPSKRLIKTESGIELIELTYENGGKTYLPKDEY